MTASAPTTHPCRWRGLRGAAVLLAIVGAAAVAHPATAQTVPEPISLDRHGVNGKPGFTHPSTCEPGSTASVWVTAPFSGPFHGYQGPFTARGTITVGEPLYHYYLTHSGSIELDFSIDSTQGYMPGYRIEGTIRGSTRIACRGSEFQYDPCCATYSARIITPDGRVYRDEGNAQVVITISPWLDPSYPSFGAAFGPSGPLTLIPACSDGIDNDGDGAVDVGADRGCETSQDGTEAPKPPPLDTTPPSLSVPDTIRVEAMSPAGAAVEFSVVATDDRDPAPAVVCDAASGATFPLGTTRVSCSAIDAAGNRARASFEVVVVDTTPPRVACEEPDGAWHAGNVSLGCTASDSGSGLADPADASFALTTSVPDGAEDADAATDTRTVCDAAGSCTTAGPIRGNKIDRGDPTLSLPDSFAVNATSPAGAVASYTATAQDRIDPSPALNCTPAAGQFAIGTTRVNCSATDHVGNTASGSFTIHVKGAREQIDDLVAKTIAMLGVESSDEIRGPLNHALDALLARDPARACNLLSGPYAAGVRKAALTDAEKQELLAGATRIRAVIGCR